MEKRRRIGEVLRMLVHDDLVSDEDTVNKKENQIYVVDLNFWVNHGAIHQ